MKCSLLVVLFLIYLASAQNRPTEERLTKHECKDASFYLCAGIEKRCIPQRFVCDGFFDCPSGDDEKDCKKVSSPKEEIHLELDAPTFGLEFGPARDIN